MLYLFRWLLSFLALFENVVLLSHFRSSHVGHAESVSVPWVFSSSSSFFRIFFSCFWAGWFLVSRRVGESAILSTPIDSRSTLFLNRCTLSWPSIRDSWFILYWFILYWLIPFDKFFLFDGNDFILVLALAVPTSSCQPHQPQERHRRRSDRIDRNKEEIQSQSTLTACRSWIVYVIHQSSNDRNQSMNCNIDEWIWLVYGSQRVGERVGEKVGEKEKERNRKE